MKKFTKFLGIVLLICCISVMFAACHKTNDDEMKPDDTTLEFQIPEKPADTTLEFWIAEDVSSVDFSTYYARIDVFGAEVYYGRGYSPAEIIDGEGDILPQSYVTYTVSGYPDASDAWNHITRIDIADPDVTVYGITCNSSLDEFDETMKKLGYEIYESSESMHFATLGNVTFLLLSHKGQGTLSISVEVSNKWGIHW